MQLEVGKTYKTRGGWDALIIWERKNYLAGTHFIAVHKKGTPDEVCPVYHRDSGKVYCTFGMDVPPDYGNHPADIIE